MAARDSMIAAKASRIGVLTKPFEGRHNRKRWACARCGTGVEKPREGKSRYCNDCRMSDPWFIKENP
jgi:hypothetical protein